MSKYAKYIGSADVRFMGRADWKRNGIDQADIVFSAENGMTVPIEDISEQARAILEKDPTIVFTDEAPTEADMQNAKVAAAANRLMARQAGEHVLHAQDPIPALGEEKVAGEKTPSGVGTPGATVQGSDATSTGA